MVCLQHLGRTLKVVQSLNVKARVRVIPAVTPYMAVVLMVSQQLRERTMRAAQTLMQPQKKVPVGGCSSFNNEEATAFFFVFIPYEKF